MVQSVSPMQ